MFHYYMYFYMQFWITNIIENVNYLPIVYNDNTAIDEVRIISLNTTFFSKLCLWNLYEG